MFVPDSVRKTKKRFRPSQTTPAFGFTCNQTVCTFSVIKLFNQHKFEIGMPEKLVPLSPKGSLCGKGQRLVRAEGDDPLSIGLNQIFNN
jgi:hypothetical protein